MRALSLSLLAGARTSIRDKESPKCHSLPCDMAKTYCDAERAVNDGSYKAATDEELHEMWQACLNCSGPNHSAVEHYQRIGDILQKELESRVRFACLTANAPSLSQEISVEPRIPTSSPGANLWDESRLLGLIQDQIEENLGLEYKAAGALSRDQRAISEITKDVSAMANSAGGLIIYGLAEYQDDSRKHLPECISPVNRRDFSKEWLEQIVSQIRPRIRELRIHPVHLSSGPDHVAYAIEIPPGTTAHQAIDCRYYRRYNFQSVPMVDHEVRDVMNRKTHPHLVVKARLVVYRRPASNGPDGVLIFDLHNESDVFARYVVVVANVPIKVHGKLVMYEGARQHEVNGKTGYKILFSNHNQIPLFPHAWLNPSFGFRFVAGMESEPKTQLETFQFTAFADSMPAITGSFTLEEVMQARTQPA